MKVENRLNKNAENRLNKEVRGEMEGRVSGPSGGRGRPPLHKRFVSPESAWRTLVAAN